MWPSSPQLDFLWLLFAIGHLTSFIIKMFSFMVIFEEAIYMKQPLGFVTQEESSPNVLTTPVSQWS